MFATVLRLEPVVQWLPWFINVSRLDFFFIIDKTGGFPVLKIVTFNISHFGVWCEGKLRVKSRTLTLIVYFKHVVTWMESSIIVTNIRSSFFYT